jgi:hypothetical protein
MTIVLVVCDNIVLCNDGVGVNYSGYAADGGSVVGCGCVGE